LEQVDELGSSFRLGLPHRDDIETVALHDASGMVAEARVEGIFVRLKNL
jgi:hypothetical protein